MALVVVFTEGSEGSMEDLEAAGTGAAGTAEVGADVAGGEVVSGRGLGLD
jgi:hypothetical protein